jgi:hypothetical protein
MCISAKVISVNESQRTVKVQEITNKEMVHESVQLQSIKFGGSNAANGFCLVPAVGSVVLIEMYDNNELLYHVTSQEKVDKLLLNIGVATSMEVSDSGVNMKASASEFNLGSDGFLIKSAGISLASILLDLLNQLIAAQLIATTPAGPGTATFNPATIASLNNIIVKTNTLLKS